MFVKKTYLFAVLLMLVPAFSVLDAQNAYRDTRSNAMSVRLEGGTSWALGSGFENIRANTINEIQPYGGVGVLRYFQPWLRAGMDYSYSSMAREQLFPSMDPSDEGIAYREFTSSFHSVSVSAEYDVMDFRHDFASDRLCIWLGIGAGVFFAHGNIWTLSATSSIDTASGRQKVHVGANNEPDNCTSIMIPATVSMEYAVLPQLYATLGGGFRFIPAAQDPFPKGQAFAKLGLVFIFK